MAEEHCGMSDDYVRDSNKLDVSALPLHRLLRAHVVKS